MSKYDVIEADPTELYDSPNQPASRNSTDWNASLKSLKNSIGDQSVGLQYPPLVTPRPGGGYEIIDGHRRIACMRSLNWPKIPVLPTTGKPSELFAAVSGNVLKMKATEWVQVHLKGGMVPGGPTHNCIKKLEKVMGRDFLMRLAERGVSPAIWNVGAKAAAYMEIPWESEGAAVPEQAKLLEWILKFGVRTVSSAIASQNSKGAMRKSFEADKAP